MDNSNPAPQQQPNPNPQAQPSQTATPHPEQQPSSSQPLSSEPQITPPVTVQSVSSTPQQETQQNPLQSQGDEMSQISNQTQQQETPEVENTQAVASLQPKQQQPNTTPQAQPTPMATAQPQQQPNTTPQAQPIQTPQVQTEPNTQQPNQTPQTQPAPPPATTPTISTEPQPATPESKSTPPLPPLPPQEKTTKPPKQPKNPINIIKLILMLVAAGVILGALWFFFGRSTTANNNSSQAARLEKYNKDSDGDGFPDFVEIELGFDSNENLYTKCYGNNPCNNKNDLPEKNVMFVLSSAESMNLTAGETTKMQLAKTAIEDFIKLSDERVTVGLTIFGNAGSSSEKEKDLSCNSSQILAKVGEIDETNANNILTQVTPTGWVNMGVALNKAMPEVEFTEGDKNIILISDSSETCDTNPKGAAAHANKVLGIKVHVIGVNVDSTIEQSLSEIATEGGGTYLTVTSSDELRQHVNQILIDNSIDDAQIACKNKFINDAYTCYYTNQYQGVYNWIMDQKLKLNRKEISQDEYNRLIELEERILSEKNRIVEEERSKI